MDREKRNKKTFMEYRRFGKTNLNVSVINLGTILFSPPPLLSNITHPYSPIQWNARFCLSIPAVHTLAFGMTEPDDSWTPGNFATPENVARINMDKVPDGIPLKEMLFETHKTLYKNK